jgi:hypothetical protein
MGYSPKGRLSFPLAVILLTGLNGAIGVAQTTPSRPVTLSDLTVPSERLPEGCALSAAPVLGIPTNPWLGTDAKTIASLRQGMGEVPLVTDAPLTRRDASRYSLQLAEGVEEGYAAVYGPEGQRIIFRAVTFTKRNVDLGNSARPANATRFEIGRIVALISGGNSQCFRAIESFLKALSN